MIDMNSTRLNPGDKIVYACRDGNFQALQVARVIDASETAVSVVRVNSLGQDTERLVTLKTPELILRLS